MNIYTYNHLSYKVNVPFNWIELVSLSLENSTDLSSHITEKYISTCFSSDSHAAEWCSYSTMYEIKTYFCELHFSEVLKEYIYIDGHYSCKLIRMKFYSGRITWDRYFSYLCTPELRDNSATSESLPNVSCECTNIRSFGYACPHMYMGEFTPEIFERVYSNISRGE